MAPHNDSDLVDSSGYASSNAVLELSQETSKLDSIDSTFVDKSYYTPSIDNLKALQTALRLSHSISNLPSKSWITSGPQSIDSHDREGIPSACVLQLSLGDLQEIEDAVVHFEATGLPLNKLQAEQFPLPALSVKIRELALLLPSKQPYFIIRGLKPCWYSKYKNVVIYTGIASHVGTKRACPPRDKNVLHHITNMEIPSETEKTVYRGPANRTMAIPFHTDHGEMLSLYTLSRAATGGDFYLADIHDITAQIEKTRPDILQTLREPWLVINPNTDKGYDERPLLFTLPTGDLAIQCSRSRLFGTHAKPRPATMLPLTTQQTEAVDALHVAGQRVAKRFALLSGDIMFFNNRRMMHARDSFVDGNEEENTTKRYLMRLILRDERNAVNWEVPEELQRTWEELYGHDDEEEVFAIHEELFSYKAEH